MTTHQRKRCISCGVRYSFQGSGWGAPKYNHAQYCEGCYEVVCNALKNVPTLFKKDLVETDAVTLDQLREWEAQSWADQEKDIKEGKRWFPPVRRIGIGMYDTESGQAMKDNYVTGRDEFHHRVFNYQYWPGKEDEALIREEVEVNVETGATRPWSLSAGFRPVSDRFLIEKLPEGALPVFGDGPDQVPTTKDENAE